MHLLFANPEDRCSCVKALIIIRLSIFSELCCSRMEKFDQARTSYGTDEDTLFVYKDGVS